MRRRKEEANIPLPGLAAPPVATSHELQDGGAGECHRFRHAPGPLHPEGTHGTAQRSPQHPGRLPLLTRNHLTGALLVRRCLAQEPHFATASGVPRELVDEILAVCGGWPAALEKVPQLLGTLGSRVIVIGQEEVCGGTDAVGREVEALEVTSRRGGSGSGSPGPSG